ncbi:hypothetical protein VTH06DRAFT_1653 [Thermothelomyces fergusii]
MASTSAFYAVVAGVGAGTGRSLALRFARAYPVVLIARNPSSYDSVVAEIRQQGGEARGISADTSDPAAVASALDSNVRGLFNFAQATLPSLLDAVPTSPHPPTLLITGATGSVRGSARFGTFAAGKFAVRALGQSLAREFGPKGVHVAHVIVDGVIDIPRTRGFTVNDGKEDGKISPDAIAESYWHLHTQHRSSFTQELDLRPFIRFRMRRPVTWPTPGAQWNGEGAPCGLAAIDPGRSAW